MNRGICGAIALAASVMIANAASADIYKYNFSFAGDGITTSGTFWAETSSIPGVLHVTDITGTFADTNAGVSGAITGMYLPLSYTTPETTPVGPAHTTGGLSYDDTFYPAGNSPNNCPDYPFFGGVFDVYGLAFNIEGGYVGGLWSDGVMPPPLGLTYAAGLADAANLLDVPNAGGAHPGPVGRVGSLTVDPVPEPASLPLLAGGLAGIAIPLGMRRSRKARAAV